MVKIAFRLIALFVVSTILAILARLIYDHVESRSLWAFAVMMPINYLLFDAFMISAGKEDNQ